MRSAIEQRRGDAAHVQRCRIHKLRNVTKHLPKAKARQTRWVMVQALKGYATAGMLKLKSHATHLKAQHPDAAVSLLVGPEDLFTINRLGVTGELARSFVLFDLFLIRRKRPHNHFRRRLKPSTMFGTSP